jgi:hypothetical protein
MTMLNSVFKCADVRTFFAKRKRKGVGVEGSEAVDDW